MDYQHVQIAEMYDLVNPQTQDADFYLSLAGLSPCSVLDLGCGTGTLCCAFAERGHRATGVDPAAAMLTVARRKPYAKQVEWVQSSAQNYRAARRFDLIVMTGHAFQINACLCSFILGFQSQDSRRLFSEARAVPPLMSGTMTNSRTLTPDRSTRYSSTWRIELGGLKFHCWRTIS